MLSPLKMNRKKVEGNLRISNSPCWVSRTNCTITLLSGVRRQLAMWGLKTLIFLTIASNIFTGHGFLFKCIQYGWYFSQKIDKKKKSPKERSSRREERKRQRANSICLRSHCKGRSGNHFIWLLLSSLDRTEEQGKIRIAVPICILMSFFSGLYWNYTNAFF